MNVRSKRYGLGLLLVGAGSLPQAAMAGQQLEINLSSKITYDTNVAHTSDQAAEARGINRDDIILTPSIDIATVRQFGRHSLALSGALGYKIHQRNKRLDREFINATAAGQFSVSRCTLTPTASISRAQTDLGEAAFVTGTGNDVKNTETKQIYGANVACGAIVGISPYVGVTRMIGNNDNIVRKFSDHRQWAYTGGLKYQNPTLGTISLFGSIIEDRFPNRGSEFANKGNKTTSFGGRFERDIGARMKGSVELSHVNVDPFDPLVPSFSGLAWGVDLTVVVTPQAKVSLFTSKNTGTALGVNSQYHVDRSHGINLDYAFNSRWSASAGFSLQKRRYIYPSVLPAGIPLQNDRHRNFNAAIVYKYGQRLSFSLEGGTRHRNAEGTFYDYNSMQVAFGARMAF